ncbi:unnamed protein product [Amoebophrya sp. A120]|nr:unnamed protein product [Amoebophrya sp. A120]|eukprot:GSA120T00017727001.1
MTLGSGVLVHSIARRVKTVRYTSRGGAVPRIPYLDETGATSLTGDHKAIRPTESLPKMLLRRRPAQPMNFRRNISTADRPTASSASSSVTSQQEKDKHHQSDILLSKVSSLVQDATARALWAPRSVDFLVWRQELPDRIQSVNYLAKSTVPGAGDGVFAGRKYKKGEPVEINPFMRIEDKRIPMEFSPYKFDDFTFSGGAILPPVEEEDTDEVHDVEDKNGEKNGPRRSKPLPHRPSQVNDHSLVIMGFGSYMNHAEENNVDSGYFIRRFALFKALRDIEEDEELFIHYGKNYQYSWDRK